jgi:hypothetical protein
LIVGLTVGVGWGVLVGDGLGVEAGVTFGVGVEVGVGDAVGSELCSFSDGVANWLYAKATKQTIKMLAKQPEIITNLLIVFSLKNPRHVSLLHLRKNPLKTDYLF